MTKLTNSLNIIEAKINKLYEGNRFGHKYSLKLWKKNGMKRIYINKTNGRNNNSEGYIDLNSKELNINDWKIEDIIKEYEIA
jgi:hypothetical protein